jgi:hypothetical protein
VVPQRSHESDDSVGQVVAGTDPGEVGGQRLGALEEQLAGAGVVDPPASSSAVWEGKCRYTAAGETPHTSVIARSDGAVTCCDRHEPLRGGRHGRRSEPLAIPRAFWTRAPTGATSLTQVDEQP